MHTPFFVINIGEKKKKPSVGISCGLKLMEIRNKENVAVGGNNKELLHKGCNDNTPCPMYEKTSSQRLF